MIQTKRETKNRTQTTLTTWEAKERVGLLALETDEWREKRLVAEDPNTTADVLARFADEALEARKQAKRDAWTANNSYARAKRQNEALPQRVEGAPWRRGDLLVEALASHPNTPPQLFSKLIGVTLSSTKAFCRNPVTPFLLLEQPDFLSKFGLLELTDLLSEADAPLLFLRMVAEGNVKGNVTRIRYAREVARMHIALAGEVLTAGEWRRQITDYWRAECALASPPTEDIHDRRWYADLVEMGLAPAWANGKVGPPAPEPPLLAPDAADAIVDEWLRFDHVPGSDEEAALLNRIGARVEDKELVARGLRENAKPSDMIELLQAPGSGTIITCRAILRHPRVQADVIRAIPYAGNWHDQQLRLSHPQVPMESIAHLCQSEYADVRRLARRHPNAPADAIAISRAAFLDQVKHHMGEGPPAFGIFVAYLHGAIKSTNLHALAKSRRWTYRLGELFQVEATDEPLPGDPYERTGRELLEHLSCDGNRLVRWAAQKRLVDPDFTFQF